MMRTLFLKLLWLYQHTFSLAGWGSCRYYPSCSEYAKWQFEHQSIPVAFFRSLMRILRCNQLFDGGIDYPKRSHLTLRPAPLDAVSVKYWLVPDSDNHFTIVKNFSFKGSKC